MDDNEFELRYQKEIPIFQEWGNFVNKRIIESLIQTLGDKKKVDLFLKICPKPRIKDVDSILAKAFYRNKIYKDPYEEITDKVGLRYVVLLRKQIEVVSTIIEGVKDWTNSRDRDFEEEIKKDPAIFGYQSVHYVVRNQTYPSVPIGTPCEIQIRTLLQHANSELTHDTIYKQSTMVNPKVRRSVAKSMALIETTDDIFEAVDMTLRTESENINSFYSGLKSIYDSLSTSEHEIKTNIFILDAMQEILKSVNVTDIEKFVSDTPYVKEIIRQKSSVNFMYKQPVVLLILFLITKQRRQLMNLWPLPDKEIQPLFTDMGVSFRSH